MYSRGKESKDRTRCKVGSSSMKVLKTFRLHIGGSAGHPRQHPFPTPGVVIGSFFTDPMTPARRRWWTRWVVNRSWLITKISRSFSINEIRGRFFFLYLKCRCRWIIIKYCHSYLGVRSRWSSRTHPHTRDASGVRSACAIRIGLLGVRFFFLFSPPTSSSGYLHTVRTWMGNLGVSPPAEKLLFLYL